MNRRDFIKAVPTLAVAPLVLGNTTQQSSAISYPAVTTSRTLTYPYFVHSYTQNQKFWPLEEFNGGCFGARSFRINESAHGEKWINGKLRFYAFQNAVDFIELHSRVVPFEYEIAYEVFHEKSQDPLVAPKHIYNYWAKLNPFKETKWIHPDYVDHTADGALIEYV